MDRLARTRKECPQAVHLACIASDLLRHVDKRREKGTDGHCRVERVCLCIVQLEGLQRDQAALQAGATTMLGEVRLEGRPKGAQRREEMCGRQHGWVRRVRSHGGDSDTREPRDSHSCTV